jgi:hypothetical protein
MVLNQIDHLVKMANGLWSNWTFTQYGQWSLIKYKMVYYFMNLPLTYSSTYLLN